LGPQDLKRPGFSAKESIPQAKKAIHEISCAENKTEGARAIEAFADEFGTKWPRAVAKIVGEKEQPLAFYEFPAEHWRHLRTTNP